MSEERFNLSRRKALAALGTIGVASAGAGLGTSAYFSDQETFENNQLTAGTLDLGVGYSSHYSDWSDDEDGSDTEATDDDVSVRMYDGAAGETGGPSDLNDGETGLPLNDAWLIAVDDPDQFLANIQRGEVVNRGCDSAGVGALTQADGESAIVSIGDVKPGDFGEVTFDLELCTNPGYVWMNNPGGITAAENTTTEPEADDPQEDGDGSSTDPADVELLDVVQAAVWLDDGDNYQDGGESPVLSGSLGTVLGELNSGNGVRIDGRNRDFGGTLGSDGPAPAAALDEFAAPGITRFDTNGNGAYEVDVELVDDPAGSGEVAHVTSGGSSTTDYVTAGVRVGATMGDFGSGATLTYQYYQGSDNEDAAPDEVYLLLRESDGTEHLLRRTSNDDRPNGSPSRPAGNWYTRNVGDEIRGEFAYNAGFSWNDDSTGDNYTDLTSNFAGDTEIVAMAFGKGGPASGGTVSDVYYRNPALDGASLGSFPTACFRGETGFSAVFAWWVPVDHGNEMQSDSVEFDLGFYTEQCRHNDGSGMNNDAVEDTQTDDN
ncbi:MAG: SipW-dependent-type signal peptide-containing protein [Haloplanus sp.]